MKSTLCKLFSVLLAAAIILGYASIIPDPDDGVIDSGIQSQYDDNLENGVMPLDNDDPIEVLD